MKGCISDDKQVDIAKGTEFAADCRPENQGREHAPAERSQRLTDHVAEPRGLGKQSLQLRKDRCLTVGLKINLISLDPAVNEPGCR